MQGLLLVDKPADWTSFDVVNYTRRMVATHEGKKPKNCKVGHSGTLDPFATGLLPVALGEATKFSGRLIDADKTYLATMRLGIASLGARWLLHWQSLSGQPHPGQMLPSPVE